MKFVDFEEYFEGKTACYEYIQTRKWGVDGKDYKCNKCGYTNWYKGRKEPEGYSKRCSRCKHDESLTAGTFFHRLRMHIISAFYIIYGIHESKSFESQIPEMLFRLHSRSEKLAFTEKALRDFITRFRARIPDWNFPYKAKGRIFIDKLILEEYVIFVCNSWDGSCFYKYAEAYLDSSEDSLQHFLKKYVSDEALVTIYNYEVKGDWIKEICQIQIVKEGIVDDGNLSSCCQLNWTSKLKAEVANYIAELRTENGIENLNSFLLEFNYLQNNSLYDSLNNAVLKEQ